MPPGLCTELLWCHETVLGIFSLYRETAGEWSAAGIGKDSRKFDLVKELELVTGRWSVVEGCKIAIDLNLVGL